MTHSLKLVAACCVASLLAACAAATPGYIPESTRKPLPLATKPFDGGKLDDAGVYQLTEAERALDCKKLTGSMKVIVSRLKDADNRAKPSDAALKAQAAMAIVKGKSATLDINADLAHDRGRFQAYNARLAELKCKTLDLDAELRAKP